MDQRLEFGWRLNSNRQVGCLGKLWRRERAEGEKGSGKRNKTFLQKLKSFIFPSLSLLAAEAAR